MPETPRPWHCKHEGTLFKRHMVYREDGEVGVRFSDVVASVFEEEDARLIVRAVNAHDELLEAAKFAQEIVLNSPVTNALTAFQHLSAAIAKAEDREP